MPDLLYVRTEVLDMLIAVLGFFGQGLSNNGIELSRQAGTKVAQVLGLFRQDCRQHFEAGISGKSASAGEHFIEHRAEAEDIGARVGLPPARLLRAHISECSAKHALARGK